VQLYLQRERGDPST
jgi:hypothetical protein